jgi:hypothetical protein
MFNPNFRTLVPGLALLFAGLLIACTPQQSEPDNPLAVRRWNDDTRYSITNLGDAFIVNVMFNRTSDALDPATASYLRRTLIQIAHQHASDQGRAIQSMAEENIIVAPERNQLTGETFWQAAGRAEYVTP